MRLIIFILLLAFATIFDQYLSQIGVNPTTPAYTFIPLFILLVFLRFNIKKIFSYANTHTFVFFGIYLILSLVFTLKGTHNPEIVMIEFVNSIITFIMYLCIYVFFNESKTSEHNAFFLAAVVVITTSILLDTFIGISPTNTELRKGGFAENPNISASALKFLGLCLLFLYRKNKRLRIIFLLFVLASIFMTFSRSGVLGSLVFMVLLLLNDWKQHFNLKVNRVIVSVLKMGVILTVSYLTLVGVAGYIQKEIPEYAEGDAAQRINLLLGKSNKNTIITRDDQSRYGRKNLVIQYVDKFISNPFGYGTAYSADKSINGLDTHNFYLKAAVNFGFIGLFVVLIYFFVSIKKAIDYDSYFYLVFILVLMLECIATHNVFWEKPTLIALAFMDYVLYASRKKQIIENEQIT